MENHKEKLRTIIEEYWRKELPKTKERKTKLKTETDHINDIIGPRRAGKTYLMYLNIQKLQKNGTKKEATIYINFENRKLLPLTTEYFNDLIEIIYAKKLLKKHKKIHIFLDEVQRINEWEKYVRSIYDEFKGKIKIYISGSTSKLTESELSHLLTGRHLTTNTYPLSFIEYLSFKESTTDIKRAHLTEEEKSIIKESLREYIEFGGFPETTLQRSNREEIIQTLFIDIINRDILPKAKRRGDIIEDLAYILCSNSGKLISFTKIKNMLESTGNKVSVPTIEKYFKIMKEAFLFFDIKIFSYKAKDQLQYPRKIYSIDTGFTNFTGIKFSKDKGRMMENTVAIELQRIKQKNTNTEIFYWKDQTGKEVDFVYKEGLKIKQLIQVTYASDKGEIKKREKKGLLKASKELRCNNLLTITWDYSGEETIKDKKIVYIPLWKWLIEQ